MIPPKWDAKRGVYVPQYTDTPFEGTNRMPDNGPDEDFPPEQEADGIVNQDISERNQYDPNK